jgi:hypothetical protein
VLEGRGGRIEGERKRKRERTRKGGRRERGRGSPRGEMSRAIIRKSQNEHEAH